MESGVRAGRDSRFQVVCLGPRAHRCRGLLRRLSYRRLQLGRALRDKPVDPWKKQNGQSRSVPGPKGRQEMMLCKYQYLLCEGPKIEGKNPTCIQGVKQKKDLRGPQHQGSPAGSNHTSEPPAQFSAQNLVSNRTQNPVPQIQGLTLSARLKITAYGILSA